MKTVILEKIQNIISSLFDTSITKTVIDDYGFVLSPKRNYDLKKDRIQLLITAVMHGDEIIGLEIIEKILNKIKSKEFHFNKNIGFLLCNVEAAKLNQRYVDVDLNRCFDIKSNDKIEHKRACQIQNLISYTDAVFDIHQTSAPSLAPFFVLPQGHPNIEVAHFIAPSIQILTVPKHGFSVSGSTLLEYSTQKGLLSMVLECEQNGFNDILSNKVVSIVENLVRYVENKIQIPKKTISTYHIQSSIYKKSLDLKLKEGFKNLEKICKGQIIAQSVANGKTDSIVAAEDSYIFFPKYTRFIELNQEMCNLAQLDVYNS